MSIRSQKTLIEWLDERCPPFLTLALARCRNGKWISPSDIAKATGISPRTMWRIFNEVSWEKHSLDRISKILQAARIDIFHMGHQREYMVKTLDSVAPYNHIPRAYRKKFMRRMGHMARLVTEKREGETAL